MFNFTILLFRNNGPRNPSLQQNPARQMVPERPADALVEFEEYQGQGRFVAAEEIRSFIEKTEKEFPDGRYVLWILYFSNC